MSEMRSSERWIIGALLSVALLAFFFPLATLQVPVLGNQDVSGYDLIAKARELSQALDAIRPKELHEPGTEPSQPIPSDSNGAAPDSSMPLSVQALPLIPIEIIVSFACALIGLFCCLGPFGSAPAKAFSALGGVAAVAALLHLAVANSDMHTWFREQMKANSAALASNPFAGLAELAANSVQLRPGAGLYMLAAALSLAAIVLISRVLSVQPAAEAAIGTSPDQINWNARAFGIVILLLGAFAFVFVMLGPKPQPGTATHVAEHPSPVINDQPTPVVYSVAEINARRDDIPTGTDLTIRGLYLQTFALGGFALPNQLDACSVLLYSSGTVRVQHGEADPKDYCRFMVRLQNEDTSRVSWVECKMNREDAHAALQQYGYNSLVQAHGVYASSLDFNVPSGFAGIPVLEDCSLKPLTTPIPPMHFQSTGTSDDSAASAQPDQKTGPADSSAAATLNTEADSGNVYTEVARALESWAKAQESNDATLIANCYADQVDRYFLRQNVTNTFVHDYMEAWLKDHDSRVIMFKIKNAAIYNQTPAYVQLRLTKDVVVTDSKGAAEHLTPSELSLKNVAGEWKITSERDFR
jgi:hypothetical protein